MNILMKIVTLVFISGARSTLISPRLCRRVRIKNSLDRFLYYHSQRKAQFSKMHEHSRILLFLSGTVALSFPSQAVLDILLEVPRIINVENGRQTLYDVYRQLMENCRFYVKTVSLPLKADSYIACRSPAIPCR